MENIAKLSKSVPKSPWEKIMEEKKEFYDIVDKRIKEYLKGKN